MTLPIVLLIVVVLICGSSSSVSARPPKPGPIKCYGYGENAVGGPPSTPANRITCCQDFTYSTGVTKTYCTDCDNTQPPSNCSPRYQLASTNALPSSGNNTRTITNGQTGSPNRLGTVLPSGSNNTGAPPALSITKEHNTASPNVLSSSGNPSTNTGSTTNQNQQTSGHHHKGEPNEGTSSAENSQGSSSNDGNTNSNPSSGRGDNHNNNNKN